MKPDWDTLIKEYEGSETILVADVDCTGAGESKCEEVGVEGYPTIKYGDPDDLADYSGSRELSELKAFAASLGPMCNLKNIHLCDDAKQALIKEYQALSADERKSRIAAMTADIEEAESDFKTFVEGLQKTYEEGLAAKDKKIKDLKDSGLGLLKAIEKAPPQKTEL